jgi:hypothetical protein
MRLSDGDEGMHAVGPASNWNESRYVDFWDPEVGIGGWFRIGCRPNEGHAEVSTCLYLPDGDTAFQFSRSTIDGNRLEVGGQRWTIVEPWHVNRVGFTGEMILLRDPWLLGDPKAAFTQSPKAPVEVELTCRSAGLDAVLGQDQDHVPMIFLPGQADHHYQHLANVTGTVTVGDRTWSVNGRGGKDHSWGPRNWHAKIYLRWLTAGSTDTDGFMLTRAVGPTTQTRSGFVLEDGMFHLVDSFEMRNKYAGEPHYELLGVEVDMHSGDRHWTATGTPHGWLPARHRQRNEAGDPATLRIVKSPMAWVMGSGAPAAGHCEYHDLVEDGVPVGLHE